MGGGAVGACVSVGRGREINMMPVVCAWRRSHAREGGWGWSMRLTAILRAVDGIPAEHDGRELVGSLLSVVVRAAEVLVDGRVESLPGGVWVSGAEGSGCARRVPLGGIDEL